MSNNDSDSDSITEQQPGPNMNPNAQQLPIPDLTRYNPFPKEILKKTTAHLGKGNHGAVSMYLNLNRSVLPHELVAVKKFLNPDSRDVNELKILSQCQHENIVQYFGCYQKYGAISIVMESLPGGTLHNDLINEEIEITVCKSLSMIQQIINGMTYLANKKVVHRNLSALNCMFASDNETIKIIGFRLGRTLNETAKYYQSSDYPIPEHWTSLECLIGGKGGSFTEKSDIWACGVLIWEIFSRRARVYNGLPSRQHLISFLQTGNRLERPQSCPQEIYDLMLTCWHENRDDRPTFVQLGERLQAIINGYESNEDGSAILNNHIEYHP